MPLNSQGVGATTKPFAQEADARWIMSYSAGLGDGNPQSMNTEGQRVLAHPVFPVALEWPAILASRELDCYRTITPAEAGRGVHAAHDLHLLRPIRAGDRLRTTATLIGIRAIKPGALQALRLDTVDAVTGELVARTYQQNISRGVAVVGGDRSIESEPVTPLREPKARASSVQSWELSISAQAAHVYTECARIFNPIHTDRSVALAAGLPDIILHGTATLALAISVLVDRFCEGDQRRVRRLGGRFSAMILMPSVAQLVLLDRSADTLFFEVHNDQGAVAFSQGFLVFD